MKHLLTTLFLSFIVTLVFGQTTVSGIISNNTTWSLANSPFIVTSSILVDKDVTLTIEPGVLVKFNSQKSLQIKGELIAKGTSEKNIIFTSNQSSPKAGDWGNILFMDESNDAIFDNNNNYFGGSILSNCEIEFACSSAIAAIEIENSSPFIEGSKIHDNNGSGIYGNNPINLNIGNCNIYNNVGVGNTYNSTKGCGIYISGGKAHIFNNLIQMNKSIGAICAGGILLIATSDTTSIYNNSILNNSGYGNNGGCGGILIYSNQKLIIIKNNDIKGNYGTSGYAGGGGGIKVTSNNVQILIDSNNIINNNNSDGGSAINTGQGGFGPKGWATITNNLITNNLNGGIYISSDNTKTLIKGNIINNNTSHGILIFSGGAKIENNIIGNNSVYGINLIGYGCDSVIVNNNSIIDNKNSSIYNYDSNIKGGSFNYLKICQNLIQNLNNVNNVELYSNSLQFINNNIINKSKNTSLKYLGSNNTGFNAQYNYWNTKDENVINNCIYDWFDDGSLGIITYKPLLESFNIEAPISTPTSVTRVNNSNETSISWNKNEESDLAGYKIYYGKCDGIKFSNSIDVGNVSSYILQGLSELDSIAITAYDINADGSNDLFEGHESWYTGSVTAPKPPVNLESESTPKQIKLTWDKSISTNINYYHIFRGESSNNLTEIAKISASQLYFSDYTCGKNKKYYYGIQSELPDEIVGNISDLISDSISSIWYVNLKSVQNNGSINNPFSKIQTAIDSASIGDIIMIMPGVYNDVINVNKSIALQGNNKIISNKSEDVAIIKLRADKTRMFDVIGYDLTLRNIVLSGNDGMLKQHDGIYIYGGKLLLENVIFENLVNATGTNTASLEATNCIFNNCDFVYYNYNDKIKSAFNHCLIYNARNVVLFNESIQNISLSNCLIANDANYNYNQFPFNSSTDIIFNNVITDATILSLLKTNVIPIKNISQILLNTKDNFYNGLSDYSIAIGKGAKEYNTITDIAGNIRPTFDTQLQDIGPFENTLSAPLSFPKPSNLKIIDNEFNIELNWEYPDFKEIVDHFETYKYNGNELILKDSTSLYKYIDTQIKPGENYKYCVKMISIDKRENLISDTITINIKDLAPAKVQNFIGYNVGYNKIKIKWQKNIEPDVNGYVITRNIKDSINNLNVLNKQNVDSLIDSLQIKNLRYYEYNIKAIDNNNNQSEISKISIRSGDLIMPDTVRSLVATPQPDKVLLTWTKNIETDIWKYRIYRMLGGTSFKLLNEVQASVNSYTDNTVTNELLYTYAVSAVDSTDYTQWNPAYEGVLSKSVTAKSPDVFPPAIPKNIKGSLTTFNKVLLSWDANTEADLKGYKVYRKLPSETTLNLIKDLVTDSKYNDTTALSYQTKYEYYVSSIDTIGNESSKAMILIKTGDNVKPEKISNFIAVGLPDSIKLSWDASKATDLNVYRIFRGTTTQTLTKLIDVISTVTSYTDKNVTNEINYYYAVTAIDSLGTDQWDPAYESDWSDIKMTHAIDIVPPAKPNITSFVSSNKKVRIAWSAQTETDLKCFRIYRSLNNNSFSAVDSVIKNITNYSDTQVENFKKYYYYICAVDTNYNQSLQSTVVAGEPVNVFPVIKQLKDTVIHNLSSYKNNISYNLNGSVDPDGQVVGYQWYLNGNQVSTLQNATLSIPQGSNQVKVIIVDNDGGKDSTQFAVNIDAGYYKFEKITGQNAGITAIGKEYIFVPEAGGKMQILNGSFSKIFDVSIPGDINSVSSVSLDTMMYLSSSLKTIYCFNKIGVPQWNLTLGGDLKATPTIDMSRGVIYTGVSNNNLFAIDRTGGGNVVWSYRTDNPISQPGVIIGSNYLLILTENGKSHIFDLTKSPTNKILSPSATLDLGDTIKTAPAIDINGYLYVSTTHGQLIKFLFRTSTMTGNIIWKANTYSSFNTSPVIGYDGTIYLGSTDAKLHAFDQSDGFEKWSLSLDNAISSTISINENGALYVGTTNGNLYCISENGTILWQYNSKFAIANATAYIDGCILFSNQNGELFKINDTDVFKSAVPGFDKVIAINKAPQWGTYQGNTRRSGVQAESTDLTAISELKMNQSIKVSPLPFHTTFKLSIDLKQESKALIQIIDLFGHVIYSNDFGNHSTGLYQETINGSNWVSGMYIYKVIVNNDVYTGKIIKE